MIAWDQAQRAVGKWQRTGSQHKTKKRKKNGERSESRGGQLASLTVFLFRLFSPLFSREKPWARG